MTAVRLENVTKLFGTFQVINGLSLTIEQGEFVSLLGPSGCGKTTLLRMIAGLEQSSSGTIRIGAHDATHLPPERRDIAMVFQSYALLPHLTVLENVMFPLRMRKLGDRKEQRERAEDILEMVQLRHLASRRPRELSGGQQQRVAVARAVVSRPQVLLLDEPLSNLDAKLRESMQEELIQLHRKTGLTTIFVTHDQEEALSLSDRVVLLNKGTIEQEGTPAELYSRPRTRFAGSFMGSTNIVDVAVERNGSKAHAVLGDTILPLPDDVSHGKDIATIMIRQEDIRLAIPSDSHPANATVETRIYLGARTRYVIDIEGRKLRCLTGTDDVFEIGSEVCAIVNPEKFHVLSD